MLQPRINLCSHIHAYTCTSNSERLELEITLQQGRSIVLLRQLQFQPILQSTNQIEALEKGNVDTEGRNHC